VHQNVLPVILAQPVPAQLVADMCGTRLQATPSLGAHLRLRQQQMAISFMLVVCTCLKTLTLQLVACLRWLHACVPVMHVCLREMQI
jgi:hypothetical protein